MPLTDLPRPRLRPPNVHDAKISGIDHSQREQARSRNRGREGTQLLLAIHPKQVCLDNLPSSRPALLTPRLSAMASS